MAFKSFELNSAGVRELLRSPEVQAVVQAAAEERCPEGCEVDVRTGRNRAIARIKTVSGEAYRDHKLHGTLYEVIK